MQKKQYILHKLSKDWHQRTDAQNAVVNIKWLNENCVPLNQINLNTNPWVFSHIPKTAGTSFENNLIQAFSLKDIFHINAPDLNNLPQSLLLKNKYPLLITGHHPIHGLLYQLLPQQKLVHLSLLRNPINRTISYYNYILSRQYHALHEQVKKLSFDEFLNENNLVEIKNGQAKRLAGTLHTQEDLSEQELYTKAKYSIDHCFSLVGVTEHFDDFQRLLSKLSGFNFQSTTVKNKSKISIRIDDLSENQLETIKNNNLVDSKLHEYVKSQFLKLFKESFK